jgi:acetyl-CoA carboxylase biotin carboxyl carrier protein
MVGTAYLAAEPGASPFVKVGDMVNQGQTLLIVEAMKTFNPIPSPRSGRVTQILVSDQQPVEYDEPLIILE